MLFRAGAYKSCDVAMAGAAHFGYQVIFNRNDGSTDSLETKRGQLRMFRTLDAAASVIDDIGFTSFTCYK